MRAFNIRELKNNPSTALRAAHDEDMVVVMNRDNPTALLVDLDKIATPDMDSVKMALAITLFKEGVISLGFAARMAKQSLEDMMSLLSSLDIPLTGNNAKQTKNDLATIRQFLTEQ